MKTKFVLQSLLPDKVINPDTGELENQIVSIDETNANSKQEAMEFFWDKYKDDDVITRQYVSEWVANTRQEA